ncbi:ATP-binding protein [Chloroflexota bacterium]
MKCRKCSNKAVMNMRQHKLPLCREHFLEWIPAQTQRAIEKYRMFQRNKRVLVAVSGGKDSLSVWGILNDLGYRADGLYISLGINGGINYSKISQQLSENFANRRRLILHVVNVPQEYGASIPEIAEQTTRGKGRPCSVCGMAKRHIMNRIAREGDYDVLVTGHNLDDEVAILFGNTLNWQAGYLVRQSPILAANNPGVIRKAKPLCRIYEREMAAYALLQEIDYIHDECPFVKGSKSIFYKEFLNRLEAERPGAKLSFYLSFLKAKDNGLFSINADPGLASLHPCPACGQPTSSPSNCAFCNMVAAISS